MNCLSPQVGVVITGEADEIMPDLMSWLKNGQSSDPPLGVFIRNSEGHLVGYRREPPVHLDSLDDPAYDNPPWPGQWNYPDFPILLSRGCIGRCAFCDVFSRNGHFRSRSAERVFGEILKLRTNYPDLKLHFNDSLVNGHLPRLRQFCELMNRNSLSVPMVGQARCRADMTERDYQSMRKAGFHTLLFGIETGSPKVSALMNKTQFATLEDAERAFQQAHDAGIQVGVNLIVGFPGETRMEMEETADFVIRNRKSIDFIASISSLSILPETPIWNGPEKYGVAPESIFDPHWRTTDGTNTLEEREWRKSWMYETLGRHGFGMGQQLKDEPPPLTAADPTRSKPWIGHRILRSIRRRVRL